MSGGLQFDEATSRKVEALYLTPDVVSQRCQVLKALELKQGERVLDIGSGPGLLAYDIAASVGHDGSVCGIDISDDMLTMSRRRCANQPWTDFQRADAIKLPYPDDSFDAAVSTQVYEYVANVPTAVAELHRVVRSGGGIVVMDTDYGSLVIHTENEARMELVLSAWNEHFVHGRRSKKYSDGASSLLTNTSFDLVKVLFAEALRCCSSNPHLFVTLSTQCISLMPSR
jgi:ubiquinone/menaquinone biosynthesis C-methylase UbiE